LSASARTRASAFKPTEEPQERYPDYKDPLARCRVWEIWSKEKEAVYWFVEGAQETLDQKPDPLELEGFWPFPRPMFANLTTTKLLPTPTSSSRRTCTTGSTRWRAGSTCSRMRSASPGVYDSSNEGIQRLITEKGENALYPVNNWAIFAEKGGIEGAVSWLPLEMIVGALDKLRECRTEKIQLLFQVTGMSDIMRGQASQQTTATEQAIKARFASVRVQTLQDEFARFCGDVQRIKAEIITKRFDRNTILQQANVSSCRRGISSSPRRRWSCSCPEGFDFRVTVNPDSISLTDFAALKQERMEFAQTLAGYFQGMIRSAPRR
jgi:hypothetical protein